MSTATVPHRFEQDPVVENTGVGRGVGGDDAANTWQPCKFMSPQQVPSVAQSGAQLHWNQSSISCPHLFSHVFGHERVLHVDVCGGRGGGHTTPYTGGSPRYCVRVFVPPPQDRVHSLQGLQFQMQSGLQGAVLHFSLCD